MKKLLVALFAVIIVSGNVFAGAFDKGGVLGVGSRPLGMGHSFTAVADEGSTVYWNAAGQDRKSVV